MHQRFPRPDLYFSTARSDRPVLQKGILPGAPEALAGRTVLFMTDFHMRRKSDPEPYRKMIADANADLILFGGDFADKRANALRLFDALKGLDAPLGIFAVPGNNDVEAFGSVSDLARALEKINCRLLVNESAALLNGALLLGGIDEYLHGQPDYARVFGPASGAKLLLSHYPILPHAAMDAMPDWMLSGHTHGGQFNFLGLTPYAIGFERRLLGPDNPIARISGAQRFGKTCLLVSKGLGDSRIPLRVGVRPEAHILTWNRENADADPRRRFD